MNAEKTLRSRINLIFGILCLPLVNLYLISFFVQFLVSSGVAVSDYVLEFAVPQTLYPLLNLILALIALKFMPLKGGIKGVFRPVKKDFLPWLGFFLGAVVLGNGLNNLLTNAFERLSGIELPPVFNEHNPTNLQEGILFFFLVALLPAFSEEFLFRVFGCGGLREFHPAGAAVLSAFAFGMVHATLQQIPFAIFMGLVFGLIYVVTGNLWYPVLLHFVNNAWACAVTFAGIAFGEETASVLYGAGNLLFLFAGVVSFLWLKERNAFSFAALSRSVDGTTVLRSTLTSVGFWCFTVLYGLLTVAGLTV